MNTRRWRAATAAVVTLGLVGTACGASHPAASAPSTSGGPRLSGAPITLGLVNQAEGAVTFPQVSQPMVAAVKWTDAHGGVDGRPVVLDQCETDGTPGASAACGTQMVHDKVLAVLDGEDLANTPIHPILDAAHIPMIGWNPFSAADFASATSFWLDPGYDAFASPLKFFSQGLHLSIAGYLSPNLAAAQGPLTLMQKLAPELGVKLEVASYDYTTANYAAAVADLIAKHPGIIFTFTSDENAAAIVKAIRQSGWTGPVFAGTSRVFVDQLPSSQSQDVYVESDLYDWHIPSQAPAIDQRDIQVFLAAMHQYLPGSQPTGYGQLSFGMVMDVMAVLKSLGPTNISTASLVAAMKANVDHHNFMGWTWNCATSPIPATPGVCARGVQYISWSGSAWKQTGQLLSALNLLG